MPPTKQQNTCADAATSVLKAPEPIEQRPGVYACMNNPPHTMHEDIDNTAGGTSNFSGRPCDVGVTGARVGRRQVTVWREGPVATPDFCGGDGAVEPQVLRQSTVGKRRHGTRLRVWPDPRCCR